MAKRGLNPEPDAGAPGRTPRRAWFGTVFAVAALLGAAALFAILLAHNIQNWVLYVGSWERVAVHFALPAVLLAAVLAALRLAAPARLSAALCLIATIPAIYGAELYLAAKRFGPDPSARSGADFDSRDKLRVLGDLRRDGREAFPATFSRTLLAENGGGALVPALAGAAPLLPLASLPASNIVVCNETGRWVIYRSDPHGFRNSPEVWDDTDLIVLIGDSFVHGHCVDTDQTIPAHLARRFGHVLNLGVGGSGPLAELATLREFAEPLRPPVVLWHFYEGNDLTEDVGSEWRAPILRAYLEDPGFRQNLATRQGEISERLRRHLDEKLTDTVTRTDHPLGVWKDILQVFHLRKSLGLGTAALGVIEGDLDSNVGRFARVITAAAAAVRGWGGQLIFVYLPDGERYFGLLKNNPVRERIRREVLRIVRDANLPVVDLEPVLAAVPNPADLYVFPGSHFNAAGYALVAGAIADHPALAALAATR